MEIVTSCLFSQNRISLFKMVSETMFSKCRNIHRKQFGSVVEDLKIYPQALRELGNNCAVYHLFVKVL